MALLDGQTQNSYYQGSEYGQYQFVSLQDVIDQFMVIYVGEEKVINKASRTDVAFHAQRALAELSFDTLRSFKSQSIVLPPSLVMTLPHDYVNYTRVMWCDDAGIKRPLYATRDTQNPFQIKQTATGAYDFGANNPVIFNGGTLSDYAGAAEVTFRESWQTSNNSFYGNPNNVGFPVTGLRSWAFNVNNGLDGGTAGIFTEIANTASPDNPDETLTLQFRVHQKNNLGSAVGGAPAIWQKVSNNTGYIKVTAAAETQAAGSITIAPPVVNNVGQTYATPNTTVRIGLTTRVPDSNPDLINNPTSANTIAQTYNAEEDLFDIFNTSGEAKFLEWTGGEAANEKEIAYDLSSYGDTPVYLVAVGIVPWASFESSSHSQQLVLAPKVISIDAINGFPATDLEPETGYYKSSIMWEKYKAITPAENNNDDYANDDYQRVPDERYGLDPSKAQTNGSFYVDDLYGRIHFSSNVSGKTVILDYISDSLGTEDEMQVHKLAEDAIYKWITYGVLSSKINIPEYIVQRARREKIAATRKAKLRLSNVKLEDIAQTLRGKSKQIKH